MPDDLARVAKQDAYLRKRCKNRWGAGFDLLRTMIRSSQALGSRYVDQHREQAEKDQSWKFKCLTSLHARGLRVANEIFFLLVEGFPDGALGRWRTLHEAAIIATFLAKHDEDVAHRYYTHSSVVGMRIKDNVLVQNLPPNFLKQKWIF
jgi:Family of unknown function (DUF5677)